jgi:hypothetical protein
MSKDLQEAMYLPYPMRSPTNTPTDTHNFLIRKLIRDMAHMMDPDEDYISIAATEQQTAATKAHRKKELEDAHANIKGSFCVVSRLTSLLAFYAPDFADFPSLLITNTFSPLPCPGGGSEFIHAPLNNTHSRSACLQLKRLRRHTVIPRQSYQRCRIVISEQGGGIGQLKRGSETVGGV